MPRRNLVDLAALDHLASTQDGLVTARQLRDLGMGSAAIQHRIRAGGAWWRMLPGVYLVHRGSPTRAQALRAATLYAGPAAVITGHDAIAAHRTGAQRRTQTGEALVLVPHRCHRSSASYVTIERTRRPPAPTIRAGLPFAPLPRAVVDAARRMSDRGRVDALVTGVVQSGLTTPHDLDREVRLAQIRGTALVRNAVAQVIAGTRSAPESALRRLWIGSGMPEPLWNPDLYTVKSPVVV